MLRRATHSGSGLSALCRVAVTVTATSQFLSKRTYVHGIVREPHRGVIPSMATHGIDKGQAIDRDKLFFELACYRETLKTTSLFDSVHSMNSLPHWDSIRTGDLFATYGETILGMPRYGREHRQNEAGETLRYLRAMGNSCQVWNVLGEEDAAHADAGDMMMLPGGLMIAETTRTNKAAIELLAGAYVKKEEQKAFYAFAVKCNGDTPAADMVGFAGDNTLVHWDTPEATDVAKQIVQRGTRTWRTVKIQPDCHFLTFLGGLPRYDVLVDERFEPSIKALAEADLNPIPTQWSQPPRLGLSMRACTLILRYAKGGVFGSSVGQEHRMKTTRSVKKVFGYEKKVKGDAGAPLWAQMRTGEIPDPVYQPPPRYSPPMHRSGGLAPYRGDDTGRPEEEFGEGSPF